ncbi:MAG TPA: beta-ketoacyl synthase chain length factor, partial [Streptosporangiaceae bacterium]|nr:beta-ketoacyl synthase chain length factor [Streptosporangiaceae bacterium]
KRPAGERGPAASGATTLPAGLTVLASAEWPADESDALTPLPGFVVSSFSPLVAEVAQQCLRRYFGSRPVEAARGERTAVLLASRTGDIATSAAVAEAVDSGRRVPPMLFFQSNPNAVVGYITARWGLTGPVVCTSPASDVLARALQGAALLIEDGDADAALVIVAEQERPGTQNDHGVAMLVGPASWPPAAAPGDAGDHPQEGDDEDLRDRPC